MRYCITFKCGAQVCCDAKSPEDAKEIALSWVDKLLKDRRVASVSEKAKITVGKG